MDIGDMLQRMRDPLGAPFFPPVLRLLLVVTWVLHIFFVTLALGSSSYSIYAFRRKGDYRLRLGRLAARLTPNAVGLGIVTGIAPLLFVQTIYDPIWYASNTLSGFWSVSLIFIVMGGYSLSYVFYLKGSKDGRLLWSAVLSFSLLFLAGWVMHVLHSVSIRPDQWMGWYAPGGVIDTRGITFHAFNLPRVAVLIPLQAGLSLAAMLQFTAWYLRQRPDADPDFLAWVAQQGRRLGMIVSPIYALGGALWALTEGPEFGVTVAIAVPLIGMGVLLTTYFASLRDPLATGSRTLFTWLAAILVVAVLREFIRSVSLARFGYYVDAYPYTLDWGSVLVFGVTTVAGVAVVAYLIAVIYQSGKRTDGEVGPRVERLGKIATGMLGAWFAFFLAVGVFATFVLR